MKTLIYLSILIASLPVLSHEKCEGIILPSKLTNSDLAVMRDLIPKTELGILYSVNFRSFDYPAPDIEESNAKVFERGIPKSEWKTKGVQSQTFESNLEQMESGVHLSFSGSTYYVLSKKENKWNLENTIQGLHNVGRKDDRSVCKNSPNQKSVVDAKDAQHN